MSSTDLVTCGKFDASQAAQDIVIAAQASAIAALQTGGVSPASVATAVGAMTPAQLAAMCTKLNCQPTAAALTSALLGLSGAGTSGNVLSIVGGVPVWQAPAIQPATDTTAGVSALNLGTAAGDATNNTDALTAAGLAAMLNGTAPNPTPNPLQAAIQAIIANSALNLQPPNAFVANSQAAMLAQGAADNDICIRTDGTSTQWWVCTGLPSSNIANWQMYPDLNAAIQAALSAQYSVFPGFNAPTTPPTLVSPATVLTNDLGDVYQWSGTVWHPLEKDPFARKSPSAIRQRIHSHLVRQNDFGQAVTILGDSISHAAYAGNAYSDSWPMLLGRSVRAAFGGDNIGFQPFEGGYNSVPELNTPQLHDVTFSAGWGALSANPAPFNYPIGNTGAAAENIVNGKSYSSTVSGSTITISAPTMAHVLDLMVTQQPGGGTFNVTVNGVAGTPINTAGALTFNHTISIPIVDNGKGRFTLVLTKADLQVTEINAVLKFRTAGSSLTDLEGRVSVSNYSQGGRCLQHMSESAVIRAANSACLIMALGYNDVSTGSDTDNAVFAAFKQRIDWFIQYCNVYRSQVIVPDFIWDAPDTSRTRLELKRLAAATGGLYIPFANNFYNDNIPPVVNAGNISQLNDPLFLWAERAHPNSKGHGLIFARISTAMGLPVTSRKQALEYWDWPMPLAITHASIVNATPQFQGTISTIQQVGEAFKVKLNLKHATLANFPPGVNYEINAVAFPALYRNYNPPLFALNGAHVCGVNSVTFEVISYIFHEGLGKLTFRANGSFAEHIRTVIFL